MRSRSQRSTKLRPSITAILFLAFIITTFVLLFRKSSLKPSSQFNLGRPPLKDLHNSVKLQPLVESINGTDLIWQVPESPKAAIFIAHGCNGRAANFWDRSPECPNCVGLPEERLIVLQALERKFAVLTVSSLGKCWSFGKEKDSVRWIVKWWIEKHRLEKLPVVALGASSGGYFVSALAGEMKFSGIVIMIAEGVFDRMPVSPGYPPTMFVHMPKDRVRMNLIGKYMEDLRKKGVQVSEVRCLEFPLTPSLLFDRIPGLDESLSVKLFELFREKGFINEEGYMIKDGRATGWKQALKERDASMVKFELLDHIQEELNLAFAYHEMTSLQADGMFNWFESHMT
ncbi:uncharacterized protein LOC120257867 [Dioscorea cayenensis subsp. rotundata]|uniref:Uncharacterized protein LOC120257867 n=1 Tax=Dioscorea cayennensis subsp. rotundata TaxID=55577 RepID=A0AB40B1E7_DIOCR|nr:uncharacterized protein LOC120257867 [Dioscorea cayenensis subsp. rotundata]